MQKTKKHKKSILQPKDGTCYICSRLHGDYRIKLTEEHHIFYGSANRKVSETEGFKVDLCRRHHNYEWGCCPEAVHHNPTGAGMDLWLKQEAQRKYEETHSREEFMKLIGKNYLTV